MKSNIKKPRTYVEKSPVEQKYQAPVLSHFGFVKELTANNVGSCNNDGIAACKDGVQSMVMA